MSDTPATVRIFITPTFVADIHPESLVIETGDRGLVDFDNLGKYPTRFVRNARGETVHVMPVQNLLLGEHSMILCGRVETLEEEVARLRTFAPLMPPLIVSMQEHAIEIDRVRAQLLRMSQALFNLGDSLNTVLLEEHAESALDASKKLAVVHTWLCSVKTPHEAVVPCQVRS